MSLTINKYGETIEYDYETYIWQIQFRPWHIIPPKDTMNATIDYINRQLIINKTIKNMHRTDSQYFDIKDDAFEELLAYSKIADIYAFEDLSDRELRRKDMGYRDGYRVDYSYFINEEPYRIDDSLGYIYKDNPIESIIHWLYKNFPNAGINI